MSNDEQLMRKNYGSQAFDSSKNHFRNQSLNMSGSKNNTKSQGHLQLQSYNYTAYNRSQNELHELSGRSGFGLQTQSVMHNPYLMNQR